MELEVSSGTIRDLFAFGQFDDKFFDECRDVLIADDSCLSIL